MHRIIALALLLTISPLAACTSDHQAPPTVGLAELNSTIPAQYAEFYGVWSGKWDGYWDVVFVIDQIDTDGFAMGEYYWKELVPGPWSHQTLDGAIEGNAIQLGVIQIELDETTADAATATGNFPKNTRTARLQKLRPGS